MTLSAGCVVHGFRLPGLVPVATFDASDCATAAAVRSVEQSAVFIGTRDGELLKLATPELDVTRRRPVDGREWNPSDYAHHLSRRARGLPFWFSLATYGTDAYAAAIEQTLHTTREAARRIEAAPHTELLQEPVLSVILFRRHGWGPRDYSAWSDAMLADGTSLTVPTSWHGETVMRICVVHPRTDPQRVIAILDDLAAERPDASRRLPTLS